MNRWARVLIFAALGLAAAACGLLMPVHLRAVDSHVLQQAGKNTPQASAQKFPAPEITNDVAASDPSQPFSDFLIHAENRESALARLAASANPSVQDLLRTRALTNTVIFSPSQSAAGQAFDAAVGIAGVLIEDNKLTAQLGSAIGAQAAEANRTGNSGQFEETLLDLMSLGQRLNYTQLTMFVGHIETTQTLHALAEMARNDANLPTLFSAVEVTEKPEAVANYVTAFNQNGIQDLKDTMGYGAGGVRLLVEQKERPYFSPFHPVVALNFCLRKPQIALTVKWVLYLMGGFLLGLSLHCARRLELPLERPLQVRGFHVAREVLFALGFLLVVLIVSEPYLVQESQKGIAPFRLHLPGLGGAAPAKTPLSIGGFMSKEIVMTMLLFFVLQALLYTASLLKLAEIRRQGVSARMKLRLLENEDHLFDAGLYLGFLGTIVSFILVFLHFFDQSSLMAAYSSTSFGILFVIIFKVVHLRPARRILLMESEYTPVPAEPTPPSHTFAAPL